jgi:TolB-like protein
MQNPLLQDGTSGSTQWTTERLDSWKEIASFFRREVRTVQLWEKHEGLPVRRQHHKKLGSVYAYRAELERWWIARSAMDAGYGKPPPGAQLAAMRETSVLAPEAPSTGFPHLLALPFEVIHSNSDRGSTRQTIDSFAGGLRDDLIVELGRLKLYPTNLPVKSIPSPGTFTLTFLKALAKQFSADILLTGTIRSAGSQIRISVQLIRAGDLRCLWSDRFDVVLMNVLDTQVAIACRIAAALSEHADQDGPAMKHEPAAKHGPAHHACMMGLHYWNQRSRTAIQKAFGYFQDAVELDPQCADAYAGLANSYVSLSYNHLMPARQAAVRANEAVQTALKLDRTSIAVRNAMINVLTNCTWDWSTAERECRDLIDSGQMDCRTIQLYSSLMNAQGRHQEAIGLALHAHRLEPLSVSSNTQASMAYFYGGDYDSALPFIRRALELTPYFLMGHAWLGRIEVERGNWDGAMSAFNHALDMSNQAPFAKALLAYAHAGSGDVSKASAMLRDLDHDKTDQCFPAYDVSAVQSILNQEEKALQNICRAYDTREMKTIFVKHDPRFTRLRNSPGFHQIASSMSFS